MRVSAERQKKTSISDPTLADPFLAGIKKMIDSGDLARTPSVAFKAHIIEQVQSHSYDLSLLPVEVSDLFLDLCDLLLSGRLSKMSEESFKTYMVLMTYSGTPEKQRLRERNALKMMTGIDEEAILDEALKQLREDGYIESLDDPIIKRRPKPMKARKDDTEGLL